MKIFHKLILGFFAVILLIGVAGYLSLYTSQKALQESVGKEYVSLVSEILDKIDRHIHNRAEIFLEYSNNSMLRKSLLKSNHEFMKLDDIQAYIHRKDQEWISAPKDVATTFMQELISCELSEMLREKTEYYKEKNNYNVFGEVFITNKYGANIAQTGRTSDYKQDDEQWWQRAKRDGLFIKDVDYDESAGVYSTDIGIRVDDESGDFLGIMKIILNIEEAITIIKEAKTIPKYTAAHFTLISREGEIIYSTKGSEFREKLSDKLLPHIFHEKEDHVGYCLIKDSDFEGEEKFIVNVCSKGYRDYKSLGWNLLIEHESAEIFTSVTRLGNRLLAVLILATICAILMSLLISNPISKSVIKLKDAVIEIGKGHLDTQVEVKSRDEIGMLTTAFYAMTEQLKKTLDSLRTEISERKLAEEEGRKTKVFLERVIENSRDGILITDVTGNILSANPAMEQLSGFAKRDMLGKHASELLAKDKELRKNILDKIAVLFEKGFVSYESLHKTKEGKLVETECLSSMIKDEKENHIGGVSIIRDISERKKAELELIKAKETAMEAKDIAEEASQAKSIFLANMSHEIRTPMNAVIGFTDMLLDTGLDTEQEDYAQTIKQSGESLLSLLNDILDFSKVEAGKIDMQEVDFDIEVLAYDACELIRPRLGKKDVEILCRIDDSLPALVKGDPNRIKQVFLNMMGNAAKFTEQGEIELSLGVEEEQDGQVMIHTKVRDTGTGIPQDKIESIFEIFQQVDGSTSRKYGGTGLGLSICRKIANLMGGNVWAESEMGHGSTFHFTALLKQPEKKDFKRLAPVSLSGKKVLITDDNITNLEVLTHALESAGMRVAPCSNGEEALKAIQDAFKANDPFDICILDIMMPVMDGYQLAKRIRSLVSDSIPLLAFSSTIEMGGAREGQEAGFNGFLPKPINRIKLFKMMELLLGETMDEERMEEKETKLVTQYSMREDAKHATTILLAEDNPVNQKLATKLLTKAGYKVDVAGNGKEAVEKFAAAPEAYDIILMDVQMPELNGLEATRLLREKGYTQVPIVAMTAEAMKGDKEKCLASGMNDYIAKPIKREVVFEMLRKWVIEKE